jgi:hypothetical protein
VKEVKKFLVAKFKELLGDMSYYNAAEGNWGNETAARTACQADLKATARALKNVGIDPGSIIDEGNYLVAWHDWNTRENT